MHFPTLLFISKIFHNLIFHNYNSKQNCLMLTSISFCYCYLFIVIFSKGGLHSMYSLVLYASVVIFFFTSENSLEFYLLSYTWTWGFYYIGIAPTLLCLIHLQHLPQSTKSLKSPSYSVSVCNSPHCLSLLRQEFIICLLLVFFFTVLQRSFFVKVYLLVTLRTLALACM